MFSRVAPRSVRSLSARLRMGQYKTMTSSASAIPADVVPLTAEHKANVLASAPVLAQHGVAITKQMYKTMLSNNKDLKNIFSYTAQTTGIQPVALAQSIYAYAANINDLSPLLPTVMRIAEKHAALGVKAEHYATVAENLIPAISHVLGDAFTPELKTAWYHAYWQLAKIFIDVEADLYAKGAWLGWKEFAITKHVDESGRIASFELVPTDPAMVPLKPYKPGQFITVRVWIEELQCYQNRHYSLSDVPSPDHYRITVKREEGNLSNPEGLVSTVLHNLPVGSHVNVAFPQGSFTLPDPVPNSLVFFAGGVGVTPLMSILNSISAKDPAAGPNISWIHGTRAAREHVFKDHVADLAARSNGKIRKVAYYAEENHVTEPETYLGMIKVAELDQSLLRLEDPSTLYYVCGPDSFINSIRQDLEKAGVDPKRIHFEVFHAGEI